MLAAWEIGIGSCPATVYDQAIARDVLGHPGDRWCGYVLSFGFPADPGDLTPTRAGGRRPLDGAPPPGALVGHAALQTPSATPSSRSATAAAAARLGDRFGQGRNLRRRAPSSR